MLPMVKPLGVARARAQAGPILARLTSPDQCSGSMRRLVAGLGLLAAVLALTSIAAPLPLLLLGVSAVLLTGWALYADDRRRLLRFAALNGVAILLLAWGTTERSELVIERDARRDRRHLERGQVERQPGRHRESPQPSVGSVERGGRAWGSASR